MGMGVFYGKYNRHPLPIAVYNITLNNSSETTIIQCKY